MEVQDEEIKLEFLVSGSYDALPSSYLKLRSYLNIHSSNLAKLHGLKLPECFTKTNLTCLQCFLPWSYETCSIKLLPVKKNKKCCSKSKTNSRKAGSELKVSRNHLVLKCKICNSKSHFYLPKTEKTFKAVIQEENKVGTKKKKKKKKKDKMCGLRNPLEASLKNYKTPPGSVNKTEGFASKANKANNLTANINRNVQKVDLQVKNFRPVPQTATKKVQQPIKSKNACINPNISKLQGKISKKSKNLQKLQKMIQRQKEPVKKTLKDFLTVI